MKKREIIILVLACAAVVYGAIDFLVLSKKKPVQSSAAGLEEQLSPVKAFVSTVQDQLAVFRKTDVSREDYIISRGEAPWHHDPFVESMMAPEEMKDETGFADGIEIRYSGFIQAGETIFAVINGMEYTLGETLLDLGYKVVNIDTARVILSNEANKEIFIPLEEN